MPKNLTIEEIMKMDLRIQDDDTLKRVKPDKMKEYAEKQGFDLVDNKRPLHVYNHRYLSIDDSEEPLQLLIPSQADFADYYRRVKDYIEFMREFTKIYNHGPQSELEILDELI